MVFLSRRFYKGCVRIKKRNMVAGLDIGTNTIKAALAEINYGQEISILEIGRASCRERV